MLYSTIYESSKGKQDLAIRLIYHHVNCGPFQSNIPIYLYAFQFPVANTAEC